MLRWRLISSAVIISILLSFNWLDYQANFGRPGVWLVPLELLVTWLAASELLALFRAQNLRPVAWSTYGGTLLVVLAACAPVLWREYPADCPLGKTGWPLAGLALGIALAFLGEMQRLKDFGGVIVNVALSMLVMTYVGLLMSFLAGLRLVHDNTWGMVALWSMIAIVKLSDSGAYAVGRMLGRHPMSPKLSPKKTIEGAVGGIATACLSSWLIFHFLVPRIVGMSEPRTPLWASLCYGLVIAVAGMLGDLAESLMKRDAGRKDSSGWVPGLGGVLDVIDSILAAAPAAFVFWASGVLGPSGS